MHVCLHSDGSYAMLGLGSYKTYPSISLVIVSFWILWTDLVSYSYCCAPSEAFSYSFS